MISMEIEDKLTKFVGRKRNCRDLGGCASLLRGRSGFEIV